MKNQLESIDGELFEPLSIEESQLVAGGGIDVELTAAVTIGWDGIDARVDVIISF